MDAKKVTAAKPKIGGAVHNAPVGTTLPKDSSTVLDVAFKDLGYCSEDGITNANKVESESIKAWGGATVLAGQKGKTDTFKFKLIEGLNTDTLGTVYGKANVTGDISTGITVKVNDAEVPPMAWVFDMVLKDAVKRIVVPNASITEVGDVVYKDNDVVAYEVTITAVPDKDGQTHYEYIKGASA